MYEVFGLLRDAFEANGHPLGIEASATALVKFYRATHASFTTLAGEHNWWTYWARVCSYMKLQADAHVPIVDIILHATDIDCRVPTIVFLDEFQGSGVYERHLQVAARRARGVVCVLSGTTMCFREMVHNTGRRAGEERDLDSSALLSGNTWSATMIRKPQLKRLTPNREGVVSPLIWGLLLHSRPRFLQFYESDSCLKHVNGTDVLPPLLGLARGWVGSRFPQPDSCSLDNITDLVEFHLYYGFTGKADAGNPDMQKLDIAFAHEVLVNAGAASLGPNVVTGGAGDGMDHAYHMSKWLRSRSGEVCLKIDGGPLSAEVSRHLFMASAPRVSD
ncbi:hypothetical protein KIPB_009974 [Kipferlia bialata]|uniref:Uncharacterized protein n=1 Tax=Kipferlia bialata TaxID=797122 RepID=A0A391NPJ9_9EUKA|nr:hypothetical protein KIPB_009974 [Kipferlia bialata]|eukprot:g9974.t1